MVSHTAAVGDVVEVDPVGPHVGEPAVGHLAAGAGTHIPEVLCWAHIPVTTQLVPDMSIEPPEPSTVARLCALESRWKFCRVVDTPRKRADRPCAFGSGTER
jgi:hypothetical protein